MGETLKREAPGNAAVLLIAELLATFSECSSHEEPVVPVEAVASVVPDSEVAWILGQIFLPPD